MSCYTASDNKYNERPACMMQMGTREMTDYRPNCTLNNVIMADNDITTNAQYRQLLINNADKLIKQQHNEVCMKLGCKCDGYEKSNICAYSNPDYGFDKYLPVRLSVPGGGIPPTGVKQIT